MPARHTSADEQAAGDAAPMYLQFGVAFYPGHVSREYESAYMRVFPWGQPIVALASASEGVFSSSWPQASNSVLSHACGTFRDAEGTLDERLDQAMTKAQRVFGRIVGDQRWQPAVDGDRPYGTLIMGVLSPDRLRASWLGAGTAAVARGFSLHAHTEPHTLRRKLLLEQPGRVLPATLPEVLDRTIVADPQEQQPAETATFDLEAGDTILFFGKLLEPDLRQTLQDVALTAGAYCSPAALARTLCMAMQCTVVVAQTTRISASTEAEAVLANYAPPSDQPAWLGAWAKEHEALPVLYGADRIVALSVRNTVLSVARNHSRQTREETSPVQQLAAKAAAARVYPTLQLLLPPLPAGAATCAACNGSVGHVESCRTCSQVGIVFPSVPTWFDEAELVKLDAEAVELTAALRRRLVPWWKRLFARWLEKDESEF